MNHPPESRPAEKRGRELPPLHLLRAFEAVGRTGSMRRAAETIGLSHTVVSRHVQHLELWMRRKLVQAGPRGATLTREGAQLLNAITHAFGIIAASAANLRAQAGPSMLRIWCIPGLATRWLTPRLPEITAMLTGGDGADPAEIELRAIDRRPDFAAGEADLVIGYAEEPLIPRAAARLSRPRMFPVASPGWLARESAPDSLAALARVQLIHEESHDQWIHWFSAAGVALAGGLRGPKLWDASLGIDAALKGQGVTLASRLTAGAPLDEGALVELFDTEVRLGWYYLLIAPGRAADPAVARFADWLTAGLRERES